MTKEITIMVDGKFAASVSRCHGSDLLEFVDSIGLDADCVATVNGIGFDDSIPTSDVGINGSSTVTVTTWWP